MTRWTVRDVSGATRAIVSEHARSRVARVAGTASAARRGMRTVSGGSGCTVSTTRGTRPRAGRRAPDGSRWRPSPSRGPRSAAGLPAPWGRARTTRIAPATRVPRAESRVGSRLVEQPAAPRGGGEQEDEDEARRRVHDPVSESRGLRERLGQSGWTDSLRPSTAGCRRGPAVVETGATIVPNVLLYLGDVATTARQRPAPGAPSGRSARP